MNQYIFHPFVLPFVLGMAFVLTYCLVGLFRIIGQLPKDDRKKFWRSLVTPKTAWANIRDLFGDCLFHVKIWKRNPILGYMHSSIAFGWFMIIVIGHVMLFTLKPSSRTAPRASSRRGPDAAGCRRGTAP